MPLSLLNTAHRKVRAGHLTGHIIAHFQRSAEWRGQFRHNTAGKLKPGVTCCWRRSSKEETWTCVQDSVSQRFRTMAYAEHNLPHTVIVTHACTFMLCMWCVSSGTLRQRMAERIIREDSQHYTPTVRFVTARNFERHRQRIHGGEAYCLYWCIKREVLSTARSDCSF